MKLNDKILEHYNETLRVLVESKKIIPKIEKISKIIKEKIRKNKKVFVYGNGGSFADSSHFVGELIATYRKKKRRALPFCLLCSNATSLTAWSNDFNFDDFLVREFSSLNSKGDVLFLLSTSGGNVKRKQSINLIKLVKFAKRRGIFIISLLGKGGGVLKNYSNETIIVDSNKTGTIQEIHKIILHSICNYLDDCF